MSSIVRALTGTEKATSDFVAALLILVGGVLIVGGYVYRVFIHPEWTFDEATLALWPFFTAGGILLALGWLIDRTGDSFHRRPGARRPRVPSSEQ